ncbi:MAG TPA: phage tail spike protein [Clostridium sp.]
MISVYESTETDFTNNGIIVLSECITCSIIEDLNGQFELSLEYPVDDQGKFQYLIEDNIIKADGQLFRIWDKDTTLSSRRITAHHIFYDLIDNMIENVTINNQNGAGALETVLSHTQFSHSFTSLSDISNTSVNQSFIQRNPVDCIMGATNSIISGYGGELVRNNFEVFDDSERRGQKCGYKLWKGHHWNRRNIR